MENGGEESDISGGKDAGDGFKTMEEKKIKFSTLFTDKVIEKDAKQDSSVGMSIIDSILARIKVVIQTMRDI